MAVGSIGLRKAKKQDELDIVSLISGILEEYGLQFDAAGNDKDLLDLDKYYFSNNGWFEVLTDNVEIIGTCGIAMVDENTCELRKMYLLEDYRGQGLGKMLLDSAIEKANELGYREMTLESNSVLKQANKLYLSYGFTEYKHDLASPRCDYAMKKQL